MSSIDKTVLFKFNEKDEKSVQETLTIVYDALNEKGYNSINQIVGYLLSSACAGSMPARGIAPGKPYAS